MKIYLIITCLIALSCSNVESEKIGITDLKDKVSDESRIVAKKLPILDEFAYSNFSFIQANNSGLYVTPSTNISGYVLYRYQLVGSKNWQVKIDSLVKSGRGPNEIESIYLSSKTINGDTLLFTSPGDKTILIDQSGELSEWDYDTRRIINFGYSFSYSNEHLLIPSFNQTQTDYLFKIYDLEKMKEYSSFEPRVPFGYQPSIRNEILGESPVPNGFIISFLGDKKLYLIDLKGEIRKELHLGESDIIPEPYRVSDPQESPGAIPYITKIEFFNEHLLILLDNVIWVISYPSLELKHKIKLATSNEKEKSPVLDFSISDKYLYSRIGRQGIFAVPTDKDWFN